jgi:hypothetical protein
LFIGVSEYGWKDGGSFKKKYDRERKFIKEVVIPNVAHHGMIYKS